MLDFSETVIDDREAQDHPDIAQAVETIKQMRVQIDTIDARIVELLAQRFSCTERVGQVKARAHFAPADPRREASQREALRQLACRYGLDEDLVMSYHQWVVTAAKNVISVLLRKDNKR